MTQPRPAQVGMHQDEIETPALVVDLDAYEANLDAMAACAKQAKIALRPHAKTHKSPLVGLDQVARGAVGVCCQKVGEAEIMVQGGLRDVFVSNQVVGATKLARLAALARRARISVCVDDPAQVTALGEAATEAGSNLTVLVEVDVGGGRCGVAPGAAAVPLARAIEAAPGLIFGGLQAYHGAAQHIYEDGARKAAVESAAAKTKASLAALAEAGIACPLVTGGGTGTHLHDIAAGPWQELQAGSYAFMDVDYGKVATAGGAGAPLFANSLFVLATVMSQAKPGMAVVDAGLKALAFDSGPPALWQRPGVTYAGPSDEHGTLSLEEGVELALGERLFLVPGHCDPTVNLYDWYVGLRGQRVESVWPVAARGAGS